METDTHIDSLPLEIIGKVMSYLNFYHRNTAMLVCRRWCEVLQQSVFEQKLQIKLGEINRMEEIPLGLGQRKIPNMRVHISEDSKRPSEFQKLASLLPHIKYIHLVGELCVADIGLCVQQFLYLDAMKIEPYRLDRITFALEVNQELKSQISALLANLKEATFVIWHGDEDVITMLYCLSGISKVSVEYKAPPPSDGPNTESPITGHHLVKLMARSELAKRFHDLDLQCFYLSPDSFSVFLRMPHLNLHSLNFISSNGTRHLDILAKSSLNLQSLCVAFEGPGSYTVQYSVIRALLVAKPSLKSISLSGILYDGQDKLGTVFEQWPNADGVHMPDVDVDGDIVLYPYVDTSTHVEFYQKAGENTIVIMSVFVKFNREALLRLAQHSPHLNKFRVRTSINHSDPISLSMLVDSFPALTDLSISSTCLTDVDMRIPAVPNGATDKLQKLQSLYLGYCKYLTDADISSLRFHNLKHLWLSTSPKITDGGILSVVSNNRGLRLLGLGGCTGITDRGVEAVATHLRYLQCLILCKCPGVTADLARMLADGCHMLEFIDVHECTDDVISAVKQLRGSMPYVSDTVDTKAFCGTPLIKSKWDFAVGLDWNNHETYSYL